MATAVSKDCELNCPICLEKFKVPKRLPCLHTFCESCIQSYVQVLKCETDEQTTRFFQCPLCRFKTELPNISASEWTQFHLSTDHLIASLLGRRKNPNSEDIHCEPCKIASEKNEARYHCRECKEYFCEQCLNYFHKRKRDSNLHTVTNITPDLGLRSLEMDEPCPVHTEKVIEAFCFDHRLLCCSICFATDHRKCYKVKTLDEIAMDETEIFDIDEFLNTLSKAEQCTLSAQNAAKEKLAQMVDEKESLLQSMADIISKTKLHLDTLHVELNCSIEKTFSINEQSEQFDIECLDAFQKTLIHNKTFTEAIKEHGSRKQKFVTLEKIRISLETHFERLCLASNFSASGKYFLDIEDELKNVQKWSKLATLNLQRADENPLTDIKDQLCRLGCTKEHATFRHSFTGVTLRKADSAWKPRRKQEQAEADETTKKTEEVYKKVRSILNKLTPQKFRTLVKQVSELEINTEERLKGVTDLIFEKASSEPQFSVAYASMCRYLAMVKVPSVSKKNEYVNFRAILLTTCQREFENDFGGKMEKRRKVTEETQNFKKPEELCEDLAFSDVKSRRRSMGNIRFIGELFNLKMLTENIVHDCLFQLTRANDEDNLQGFCILISTTGKELDTDKAKPRMDQYFNHMEKSVQEKKVSARVRFMVQDVIDLRKCKWIPRRDNNPKTLAQIHKEAEKEEQETQIQ